MTTTSPLATGLGWFSLGLGAAELLAPRTLARWIGIPGRENLLRGYGLREIGAGAGLLVASDRTPWLWARVGGDVLDIATLIVFARRRTQRRGIAIAAAAVAGVSVLDVLAARAKD